MYHIVREIPLGDHAITIKENNEGHRVARLTSGTFGGLIEVQKHPDGLLRIRELDIGSAKVSVENLALLLVEVGVDEDLTNEIKKIKGISSKPHNQS